MNDGNVLKGSHFGKNVGEDFLEVLDFLLCLCDFVAGGLLALSLLLRRRYDFLQFAWENDVEAEIKQSKI